MKSIASALSSGLLFSIGLGLSGMTRPSKVEGFLNLAGPWDPSLMLVIISGTGVFAICYHLLSKRERIPPGPVLPSEAAPATDSKLWIGSFLFGIGWGLGGLCPGPSIAAAFGGAPNALVFLGSMLTGQFLQSLTEKNESQGSVTLRVEPGQDRSAS